MDSNRLFIGITISLLVSFLVEAVGSLLFELNNLGVISMIYMTFCAYHDFQIMRDEDETIRH